MLIELLSKNEESLSLIRQALSLLQQAGYFSVALELGQMNAQGISKASNNVEDAALERYFIAGYSQAVNDLFYFNDKFNDLEDNSEAKKPDFGAIEALLASGDITKEEADELRKQSK